MECFGIGARSALECSTLVTANSGITTLALRSNFMTANRSLLRRDHFRKPFEEDQRDLQDGISGCFLGVSME